jgi:hypothetical protein
LNNSIKHIEPTILHFKRWSNNSYAIFNSIGRIVHIGFLSTIIHKLITVKSTFFHGLLNLFNDEDKKDDIQDDSINPLKISIIRLVELLFILNTTLVSNRIEGSNVEFISFVTYKKNFKAYFGPFLFICNSSIRRESNHQFSGILKQTKSKL